MRPAHPAAAHPAPVESRLPAAHDRPRRSTARPPAWKFPTSKSKQRVADHGEVFTPAWMAEAMLDLVKEETERIDARFLEPACGSGNFRSLGL